MCGFVWFDYSRHLSGPQVRFLREQLEKAGCLVGDNFIKAVKCNESGIAGGYTKGKGVLVSFSLRSLASTCYTCNLNSVYSMNDASITHSFWIYSSLLAWNFLDVTTFYRVSRFSFNEYPYDFVVYNNFKQQEVYS